MKEVYQYPAMSTFQKMRLFPHNNYDAFHITSKKVFDSTSGGYFDQTTIEKVLRFAWDMTFGTTGEHRAYRSGGTRGRKNGELFINTFQGKIAEYGLSISLKHRNIPCSEPDMERYPLGQWDQYDLICADTTIAVKSAAFFSNLLLLETRDWDPNGTYIPTGKRYDYFVFIRIKPDGKDVFRRNRLMFCNSIERTFIEQLVMTNKWEYDIPGCITLKDLLEIIRNRFVLPRGARLNGRIPMDAENYYAQAGDLRDIEYLISELSNNH